MPERFAGYLAYRLDCINLIGIGPSSIARLRSLESLFRVIAIGSNSGGEAEQASATWLTDQLARSLSARSDSRLLKKSVILCSDAPIRLNDRCPLLAEIKSLSEHAPACIITLSKAFQLEIWKEEASVARLRDRVKQLEEGLRSNGLNVIFAGLCEDDNPGEKDCLLAIVERETPLGNLYSASWQRDIPNDFRVVAIMSVYNEEDIIVQCIEHLIDQGVEVYIMDNWSTDATSDLIKPFLGRGVLNIEKFPREKPSAHFEFTRILYRKEEIIKQVPADWFISHDADEIRLSPWPGIKLRDAIFRIDRQGYNCIDHTIVLFPFIKDGFERGRNLDESFRYFEFGKHMSDFVRLNAWKNTGRQVSLAESGGHAVNFQGRKIYPYKFITKHYMFRSEEQGERKVMRGISPEDKAKGWFTHYRDGIAGQSFKRNSYELEQYDEEEFDQKYLIERLSGLGICE